MNLHPDAPSPFHIFRVNDITTNDITTYLAPAAFAPKQDASVGMLLSPHTRPLLSNTIFFPSLHIVPPPLHCINDAQSLL
ncbi:hypothetical protein K438DRAFT_1843230 [Mycena galopus ATCC 62051]|nr:hypothetical protein K438DRAFT_1843230 [Mycena galopus ATCC 62051]